MKFRPSVTVAVAFSSLLPVALLTSLPPLLKPEVALSPLPVSTSLDADVRLSVRGILSTSACSSPRRTAVSDSCWTSAWMAVRSSVPGGHVSRRCVTTADAVFALMPTGRAAIGGLRLTFARLLSPVACSASLSVLCLAPASCNRALRCR